MHLRGSEPKLKLIVTAELNDICDDKNMYAFLVQRYNNNTLLNMKYILMLYILIMKLSLLIELLGSTK